MDFTKFNSLIELLEYFSTEEICRKHLEETRWGDEPECPHCGHKKIYKFKDGKRFKCSGCKKQFTVKVGTLFENSKVSLKKWFMAIYLNLASRKGISSMQLARQIKVTQTTAWFMLQRIRFSMDDSPEEQLEGEFEVDCCHIGGKEKNKHYNKKARFLGVSHAELKQTVFGIMQRDGQVQTFLVDGEQKELVQTIIRDRIKEGSRIISDDHTSYIGLGDYCRHQVVSHSQHQYVIDDIYTNTLEGFWGILKRGILGIFHSVSKKYLNLYLKEFCFRYNLRKRSIGEQFQCTIEKTRNKRLTHKTLTKKLA